MRREIGCGIKSDHIVNMEEKINWSKSSAEDNQAFTGFVCRGKAYIIKKNTKMIVTLNNDVVETLHYSKINWLKFNGDTVFYDSDIADEFLLSTYVEKKDSLMEGYKLAFNSSRPINSLGHSIFIRFNELTPISHLKQFYDNPVLIFGDVTFVLSMFDFLKLMPTSKTLRGFELRLDGLEKRSVNIENLLLIDNGIKHVNITLDSYHTPGLNFDVREAMGLRNLIYKYAKGDGLVSLSEINSKINTIYHDTTNYYKGHLHNSFLNRHFPCKSLDYRDGSIHYYELNGYRNAFHYSKCDNPMACEPKVSFYRGYLLLQTRMLSENEKTGNIIAYNNNVIQKEIDGYVYDYEHFEPVATHHISSNTILQTDFSPVPVSPFPFTSDKAQRELFSTLGFPEKINSLSTLIQRINYKIRKGRENSPEYSRSYIAENLHKVPLIRLKDAYKLGFCIPGSRAFMDRFYITENQMSGKDFIRKYENVLPDMLDDNSFRKLCDSLIKKIV